MSQRSMPLLTYRLLTPGKPLGSPYKASLGLSWAWSLYKANLSSSLSFLIAKQPIRDKLQPLQHCCSAPPPTPSVTSLFQFLYLLSLCLTPLNMIFNLSLVSLLLPLIVDYSLSVVSQSSLTLCCSKADSVLAWLRGQVSLMFVEYSAKIDPQQSSSDAVRCS